MSGTEFSRAEGLPQRQEEKARARAASKAGKNKKQYQFVYTEQDGKLLKMTAKPNGAYSEFVAKKPKAGKEGYELRLSQYKALIEKFKKDKTWVDSGEVYEKEMKKLIAEAGK